MPINASLYHKIESMEPALKEKGIRYFWSYELERNEMP